LKSVCDAVGNDYQKRLQYVFKNYDSLVPAFSPYSPRSGTRTHKIWKVIDGIETIDEAVAMLKRLLRKNEADLVREAAEKSGEAIKQVLLDQLRFPKSKIKINLPTKENQTASRRVKIVDTTDNQENQIPRIRIKLPLSQ